MSRIVPFQTPIVRRSFILSMEPVTNRGVIGVAVFWFSWALDVIPFGVIAYGIYLSSILGEHIWIASVGAGPLACAVITVVLSAVAVVFRVLIQFNLLPNSHAILVPGQLASSVVALVVFAVLLKFFTPSEYYRNLTSFTDYVVRNHESDAQAAQYLAQMAGVEGTYLVTSLVRKRSTTPKLPLVAFWMSWLGFFCLHLLGTNFLNRGKPLAQPGRANDEQPLTLQHSEDAFPVSDEEGRNPPSVDDGGPPPEDDDPIMSDDP
jgi:hypothetical protein